MNDKQQTSQNTELRAALRTLDLAQADYDRALVKHLPIGHRTVHFKGSKVGVPCEVVGHGYCGNVSVRSSLSGRVYSIGATWLRELRNWREL